MKKVFQVFILVMLSLVCTNSLAATTYYVRVAGGTSTQCTGTTNADYSGTGTAQACAFSNPAWALGTGNTIANGKMVGGDILIIDDTSSAKYMIGYGMPNTSGCSLSNGYDWPCTLKPIPSGTVSAPTKILGSAYNTGCATKPQIWGTESVGDSNKGIFTATGSNNIDIECLEVTDHSTCGFQVGANPCTRTYNGTSQGSYARGSALYAKGGSNFTLKNLYIHGLAGTGIQMGGINGIVISHVDLWGNHGTGWDGDVGESGSESSMSGNIVVDHARTRFSGCREAYPASANFTAADYDDCIDNVPSNTFATDGWGFYNTGGNWIITDSEWTHNSSDGLDLLYHNSGDVSIDRCWFEGNNGNQIKISGKNVSVTNSISIADCTYQTVTNKYHSTNGTPDIQSCRADGASFIGTAAFAGGAWKFTNDTFYSATGTGGSPGIEIPVDRYGLCNGTETYTFKNLMLVSNFSATNWVPIYNGLSGSCSTALNSATIDHSLVYHFQTNPAGTGNSFSAPAFVGSISSSSADNRSNVYLTSNVGGAATASYWNTSNDFNNFAQLASIDKGALQYGSTAQLAQSGQTCVATTDCVSGTCSNFACTGSCTANGGACSSGATCCTGTCTASVCATPSTCGDGVIQTGEICDTSNLNGSTCVQQGFTGGSLSCASNCQSFVTSSCTNTTVFPLTPILDTFTRSNSTGISNTRWTNAVGSFNISSNAALPVNGANATNRYYWNSSTFTADEEAYVTMSTKGSNGDAFEIQVRLNPTTNAAYAVESATDSGHIHVYKNPGENQLGATINQALSSGDSVGMSVVGSTITVYYKASGGSWTSLGTRTDTSYTAGGNIDLSSYAGAGATPDIKLTNFGGGSLNPITCGNGIKETGETCDGSDVASQTCLTQGFASGTLACASNCNSFDTTSCVTASVCGNNTKETGEVCDGTDVNSQTCAGLGFVSGTPTCASNCLSFVTTSCISGRLSGINGGVTLK